MVFRSYAQLIRKLFNAYQCGPPVGFTPASSWPGVDHSVSRLPIPTIRHLRLAFASAPLLQSLALPEKATRRFIMQKARRQPVGLRPLVGNWFQVLFHSPCGVLFTFPSRYYTLSVSREYLALPDGPGQFTRNFSCSALLRCPLVFNRLRVRGCHPLCRILPSASARLYLDVSWIL